MSISGKLLSWDDDKGTGIIDYAGAEIVVEKADCEDQVRSTLRM